MSKDPISEITMQDVQKQSENISKYNEKKVKQKRSIYICIDSKVCIYSAESR